MGGPGASILLREALTATGEASVRGALAGLAETVEGDVYWIDRRPFLVLFGQEYEGELVELVASGLPAVFGWEPRDILGFAAMCNDEQDHAILGDLCICFAEALHGLIIFNGQLRVGPDLRGDAPATPLRVVDPDGLDGVLYATGYLTANGVYATSHYGDVAFMRSFRSHPQFRMLK